MIDLTKLDAANANLQKDPKAAASTKQFGQASTDAIHALAGATPPVPPPSRWSGPWRDASYAVPTKFTKTITTPADLRALLDRVRWAIVTAGVSVSDETVEELLRAEGLIA